MEQGLKRSVARLEQQLAMRLRAAEPITIKTYWGHEVMPPADPDCVVIVTRWGTRKVGREEESDDDEFNG